MVGANGDMVRFDNVGLRYGLGPEVLQDVTFSLESGSFHFLTGASGAGKSSLLKLMYLALKPSRGLISLFDRDIATATRDELPSLRRKVGVVFQEFRLLKHLSTFDNVALPLRIAGTSESEIRRHVGELLAWVGLEQHMHARPPTLSGGQQQRVAIARAVISRPRLLLADEPTGNVDDRMALRLVHLLEELNRLGTTIIVATHNEHLVSELGHPRMHLANGRLTVTGGTSGPRPSGPRPSGPGPSGPRPSGPGPSGPRPSGPRPATSKASGGPKSTGSRPAGLRSGGPGRTRKPSGSGG